MIRLSVIGEQGRAALVTTSGYFRITGGVVWLDPGQPLVRYVPPGWKFQDTIWSGLRLEGRCRLVFGLPRNPAGISDALESLSIYGTTLSANGIPFAVYDPERDMWRGVVAESWWHAFRIESVGLRPPQPKRALRVGFRGEVIHVPPADTPPEDGGPDGTALN